MSREEIFIKNITDKVYKMLVLREKEDDGDVVYLNEYISDIFIEINGAPLWSDVLKNNGKLISVMSTIAYLSQNETSFKAFRREVFKMLNLLNKISVELSGGNV